MENTQADTKPIRIDALNESLRVQKTAYIKQQMERQRAAEDARLERLLREQEVIEGLRESIDDGMWQTEGLRKYNREYPQGAERAGKRGKECPEGQRERGRKQPKASGSSAAGTGRDPGKR